MVAADSNPKTNPNIKILIACHKAGIAIPDSKYLMPIQVGAALSDEHFEGMAHDDDSKAEEVGEACGGACGAAGAAENISAKNGQYCELTGIYWAWKNLDADYYGLMHYRRYFSFADKASRTNLFGDVLADINDEETLAKFSITDEAILHAVDGAELILPEPGRFAGSPTMEKQIRDSWQMRDEDLELLREIVAENSPEIAPYFDKYMHQKEGYFCNMFIMSRDVFMPFCEWMFAVLEEHERRGDYSDYSVEEARVSGYLSERLLGVYALYLSGEKGIHPKHLQKVFFKDVVTNPVRLRPSFWGRGYFGGEPPKQGRGCFGELPAYGTSSAEKTSEITPSPNGGVTAVMAASDNYVPYLSALLQSIKDNCSDSRYYDLVVLTSDISAKNQRALKQQIEAPNISLRFYDVTPLARGRMGDLKLRGHFQIETYYRLFMQEVFADWDKVLYLDSDMIVLRDIAEAYDTDINGYLLAACKDADTAGLYNGYDKGRKQYMDTQLALDDPYGYFQAGTILFNLDAFRETYEVEDMFALAGSANWKLLDQDVLNVLANNCVKYLPMEWNVMTDWRGIRIKRIISLAPKDMFDEYMAAREDPSIVHYAGTEKPWNDPESDMANYFWEYVKKTPYYEALLERLANGGVNKKPISDAVWDKLYPVYNLLFPDRSRRREMAAALYRKFVAGKKD